jgi:hypothetical protein
MRHIADRHPRTTTCAEPAAPGVRLPSLLALCVLLFVPSCAASTAPLGPSAEAARHDAERWLRGMTERYATYRSYEDTGIVTSVTRSTGAEPHTSRITFATAFDRASGAFFFEYREPSDVSARRGVAWRRTEGPTQVWLSIDSKDREGDLATVVSSLAGVSHRVSRHVPAMLMGWGAGFSGLETRPGQVFDLDGEESVGGSQCTRLAAQTSDAKVILWIGKANYALRKIYRRTQFPQSDENSEFTVDEVIEYSPVFDTHIDQRRFDFVPPSESEPKTPAR